MDESKVISLIAEGEGTTIEFKRELDLSSARGKAEFVKDILSLANSAHAASYMLIGVNNSKAIVGIAGLEEEQIQQVALTYIDPAPILRCIVVPVHAPDLVSVGILEAKATKKPHKVARAIEQLSQNDVFVRHGSVVVKASPEEIKAMYDETRLGDEARQYIRSAEMHLKLGNTESAIRAYSKAVEAMPTAELLLARSSLYEQRMGTAKREMTYENRLVFEKLVYKDLSDALSLVSNDKELEKKIHLLRLKYDDDEDSWKQDLEWLKANVHGREYGQVLCMEVATYDNWSGYITNYPEEALKELDEAVQLGFTEPEVYYLRAMAHFTECNYGLALKDIDAAINSIERTDDRLIDYLPLQASILSRMQSKDILNAQEPFDKAYDSLLRARQLSKQTASDTWGDITWGMEVEILYRCALDYEFRHEDDSEIRKLLVQILALSYGSLDKFSKVHPKIANTISNKLGTDFWEYNKVYFSK